MDAQLASFLSTTRRLEYALYHVKRFLKESGQAQREGTMQMQYTTPSLPQDIQALLPSDNEDMAKKAEQLLVQLEEIIKQWDIYYITLAHLPDEQEEALLCEKLKAIIGKEHILFAFLQDSRIYGGFILRTKRAIFDRSFRTLFDAKKGSIIRIIQSIKDA